MTQAKNIIRKEHPQDIAAINEVHKAAFPSDIEARLVDALRASKRLLVSLVAEESGRIVGHIAFSPVTIHPTHTAHSGVGLAPVGVLPDYQGGGVGRQLIRQGLEACTRASFDFVVVLGEPDFYGRFGFARASDFGLGNEYGIDEPFMVLALREGGIPAAPGTVRYAPEFGLVA